MSAKPTSARVLSEANTATCASRGAPRPLAAPPLLAILALSLLAACFDGGGSVEPEVRAAGEAELRTTQPETYPVSWDGRTLRHGLLGLCIAVPVGWEIASAAERESIERSLDRRFQDSLALTAQEMEGVRARSQECSKIYFTAFAGRNRSAGVTCMVVDQSAFPPDERMGETEFLQAQVETARRMGQSLSYGTVAPAALAGQPCHGVRSEQWTHEGLMVTEEYCLVRGDQLLHLGVLWKDPASASRVQEFLQGLRAL